MVASNLNSKGAQNESKRSVSLSSLNIRNLLNKLEVGSYDNSLLQIIKQFLISTFINGSLKKSGCFFAIIKNFGDDGFIFYQLWVNFKV